MYRAYCTPGYCWYSSQRIEIRCYKMVRADGTYMVSIYSHIYLFSIHHSVLKLFTGFDLHSYCANTKFPKFALCAEIELINALKNKIVMVILMLFYIDL